MPGINTATENITGLSPEQVQARFKQYGYNELPSQKKRTGFVILLHVLKEPMLLLLLGCGSIYFSWAKRRTDACCFRLWWW
jgi:Cation transport ATPase